MTEAMPFLQKTILLSYDPRPLCGVFFHIIANIFDTIFYSAVGKPNFRANQV